MVKEIVVNRINKNIILHTFNRIIEGKWKKPPHSLISLSNRVKLGTKEYLMDRIKEDWCKDLFGEYEEKVSQYDRDSEDWYQFQEEYQVKLVERLRNLNIQVNEDHNHPSPYERRSKVSVK